MKRATLTRRCMGWIAPFFAVLALSVGVWAQSGCQSGNSNISYPGNNNTISTTYTVVASASTGGNCIITAMRLYVDNKSVYTVSVSAQNVGFSHSTTFSPGFHNLVVVSWNNEGYAFTSPGTMIYAAPYDQTVYITSPAANATLTSTTVTFAARARWDNQNVSHMRAYIDNKDVYDAVYPLYAAIQFQKVVTPGTHYLVVIAWDNAGNYIKAAEYFTVK
jgi:hypothetical protein